MEFCQVTWRKPRSSTSTRRTRRIGNPSGGDLGLTTPGLSDARQGVHAKWHLVIVGETVGWALPTIPSKSAIGSDEANVVGRAHPTRFHESCNAIWLHSTFLLPSRVLGRT